MAASDVPLGYADFGKQNCTTYQPFKASCDPCAELVLVFHFKNGGYLAIMFSSFLMKLFLLPTEEITK